MGELALYGIGGILQHARALLGFAAPTSNSYRRPVPGFDSRRFSAPDFTGQ